ncbi:uncharacterized protein LOC108674649 [Hyalella azteca]|uniref:Uncharacterized protein LOC108674649 n=1 Tax=Hyalella azteca TaxID=294128 RepID=A0A8B7NWD6_HYAAZ|nr:uncharacterized protein LOC108674649 [Hyalella azteca]
MQSEPGLNSAEGQVVKFPIDLSDASPVFKPMSMLHQPSLNPFPMHRGWGGVGGFASPTQPTPPLCAPPHTIASTLGNPQMPASSTYNTNSSMDYNFRLSSIHMAPATKRKSRDEDMEIRLPAAKQHITEDKVSASLSSLHLSNQYTSHQLGTDAGKVPENLLKDGSDDDSDGSQLPRLYVSTDINKIPLDDRNLLPDALLKNLKRSGPCMDVVLWRPPAPPLSAAPLTGASNDRDENSEVADVARAHGCNVYGNVSNSENIISSPDSGVSISPPSNSVSLDLPCDMDEENSAAGVSSNSAPNSSVFQIHPQGTFSNNPFSLFYPSNLPTAEASCSTIAQISSDFIQEPASVMPKNYASSASAAYTRAWLEQNNNVVDASSVPAATALVDDDEMDL